jgi:hypothetical protein
MKPQLSDDILSAYLTALQTEAGVTTNEQMWQAISGQQTN